MRMTVAYDGTDFHGFAANQGVVTVGGTLIEALERVLGRPVDLACAGRTDAGVHAWGQVVSFDAPAAGLDLVDLGRAVTKLCGGPIVVRRADVAPPDFHARFSAMARVYRYTVRQRAGARPVHCAAPRGTSRPRSISSACAWAAIPSSARTTSRRSAGPPGCARTSRPRPWCAG